MAKCRGCGAEVIWIKTGSGSSHPCDPEQVLYRARPRATGRVVTPDGVVHSCDFVTDADEATGSGYVSHFSTCPAADRFRKGGRR